MIDKMEKKYCTGCDACYNICPNKSISMETDNTGFRYPIVDNYKCTKCSMCINICPSISRPKLNDKWSRPKVFAAWSLDEVVRLNSTSGGIFSELARKILADGGVVVGAQYNDMNIVEHCMIDNIKDLVKLAQSKYVQSEIGDILKIIKLNLVEGRRVAFCGSPCQVAGLLNYLQKPYSNLITFDFICRGTNSPKAYLSYLEMIEKEYKSEIKKVWFKNKTYGWNRFSTRIDLQDRGIYIKDRYNDLYMRGYIEENLYMRPCCFDCKYKSFPRIADITLGDFWGVSEIDTSLDSDKGTSLIMVNSDKGEMLFDSIKENIFQIESDLAAALPGNGAILKSAIPNPSSEKFLNMLDEHSFDVSFYKCANKKLVKIIKSNVYKIARPFIKKILMYLKRKT